VFLLYETNQSERSVKRMLAEDCWFKSVHDALSWFNSHNPARMRSVNLLERDRGSSRNDRSAWEPDEKWAFICRKLQRILRQFPQKQATAFERRFFGERCRIDPRRVPKGFKPNPDVQYQLSWEEIADLVSWDVRTVKRRVREVLQDVERAFMRAGIIPKDFDA
jgi:hypothetical protein